MGEATQLEWDGQTNRTSEQRMLRRFGETHPTLWPVEGHALTQTCYPHRSGRGQSQAWQPSSYGCAGSVTGGLFKYLPKKYSQRRKRSNWCRGSVIP